jgi:protein-disulfide isomerase
MNTKTIMIFVAVTLGILIGVGALLTQFSTSTEKPIADIAGSSLHVQGSGSIEIVEFSDFQCPACAAVQSPLKELLAKYDGKVKFVYRHFPLTQIHKNAQISAQAGEAAGMQDKFWQMHDKLFETQAEWEGLADPKEVFAKYSEDLGMDRAKFEIDMISQEVKDIVAKDALAANQNRMGGTPTFYVNGVETDLKNIEVKIVELSK